MDTVFAVLIDNILQRITYSNVAVLNRGMQALFQEPAYVVSEDFNKPKKLNLKNLSDSIREAQEQGKLTVCNIKVGDKACEIVEQLVVRS